MRTSVLRSWFPQFLSLPEIVKQEMDFVFDWECDPDVFLSAKQESGLAQQQILPINSIWPVPTTVSTAILLAPVFRCNDCIHEWKSILGKFEK
jgi:hypothetical protein